MSNPLLDAALSYAKRGWNVIPLHTPIRIACSCRNPNCDGPGKHPRLKNWTVDASSDFLTIQAWWESWPVANVGILTGSRSNLLVVDLDDKADRHGSFNFQALAARFGGLPITLMAKTGSGGSHMYFQHPDIAVGNSVGQLAPGVDVRADRGQVVAPPSKHANGNWYEWLNDESPAPVPEWLLDMLLRKSPSSAIARTSFADEPERDGSVFEGERNDKLFRIGTDLRGQFGMDDNMIVSVLLEYNKNCRPMLERSEVIETAESACRYPREVSPLRVMDRNPLPWFSLYWQETLTDANITGMDAEQRGWHLYLLVRAWGNCGYLTADLDELWRQAGASSRRAFEKKAQKVLASYVQVDRGAGLEYKHPALAHEFITRLAGWLKKKDGGYASGLARQSAADDKSRAS